MISKLVLENFYSVRDPLEINLSVSAMAPDEPERFGVLYPNSEIRVPRILAFYGPNAAGKSTILKALGFISWYIEHGFAGIAPGDQIYCYRFNSEETNTKPVRIGVEFGAPSDLMDRESEYCRYSYELVLGGGRGQPTKILHETLCYWPPNASRRVKVFERAEDGVKTGSRGFHLQGFSKALARVLRPNVSLISTLVQLGHEPSLWLKDFFAAIESNIIVERFEYPETYVAEQYINDAALLEGLNREIQRLDLGIKQVSILKSEARGGPVATNFVHVGLADALPINNESHGTRQFFKIYPVLYNALEAGGIAVIDEFDSSIHPLLLPEIVRWFHDPVRNKKNAQLWFSCQNAYLLEVLEKEEIFFCEKDQMGCTTVFGLSEVKSVRRVENYARKYLGGAFGAVPHIG